MTPPDLSRLRDIHLPAAVSWWPPATGWWILAAALLFGALFAAIFIRRRHANRWRRAALDELKRLRDASQTQDLPTLLGALSVLLRRVAIGRFPRDEVASLYGDQWLAFLDRTLGQANAFQSNPGRWLGSGPYLRQPAIDANDLAALFSLAEKWIRKLPGGARK